MWILPNQLKSLISASAPDTEASTLDLRELSATCARSLTVRGKQPPSNSFSRAWKAGNLMRLQSGLICDPSRGQRFLTEWTSSLVATPASPSAQQASDSELKTSGTSGQPSQMAFAFCDPESASSRTSRDTSPLGCEKLLQSWKDSVTARRGEYSARLKLAHRTSVNGCSSWPTAKARDWKDTTGCSLDAMNPDGTHRNRRDRLVGAIAAEMHGQAAPANPSTHGSRPESLPTPDATNANDGVPWEKFHASMMERRAQVKKAVAEGKTKQGSGRSPNLAASVQNPQWATPKCQDSRNPGLTNCKVGSTLHLGTQAARLEQWATPQTRDNRSGGAERWDNPERSRNLNDQIASQTKQNAKLNPRWVEALMGLPIGWVMASCASPVTIAPTSFGCWATESSPQPQPELL